MTTAIEVAFNKRTQHFEDIIRDDKNLRTWWFILDRCDLNKEEKQFILEYSIKYVKQYVESKLDEDYFQIRFDRFIAKEIRHNIRSIYDLKGWNTIEVLY